MPDQPSDSPYSPLSSLPGAPGGGPAGGSGTPGGIGGPGQMSSSSPPPLSGSAPPMMSSAPPVPPRPAASYKAEKSGLFSGSLKFGTMLSGALLFLGLGFYGALFNMASQSGPTVKTYRPAGVNHLGERTVAILPINGTITDETAAFVHDAVQSIIDNKLTIGAVVLRVNSPGGGATASDEMLHEIKRLRAEAGLPIIASYGGYAASGGYYISCDADRIFAQPTTITGSIGVIAPYMTFENLLDKVGITPETLTSTAAINKDTGSPFRAWSEKDRTKIRVMLDGIQDQFVKVVTAGREGQMDAKQVLGIATGLPLMADAALQAGLVDEIGYIDAAIAYAISKGGFSSDEPRVDVYGARKSVIDSLGVNAGKLPLSALNFNANTAREWMTDLAVPQPMMIFMP